MKRIVLFVPGLADSPLEGLDHKTPLAAAKTPFLRRLRGSGTAGRVKVVSEGEFFLPELSFFHSLGYETAEFPGRAMMEAGRSALEAGPGQTAMAFSFVTVSSGKIVDARAGGIGPRESSLLVDALSAKLAGLGIRLAATGRRAHVSFWPEGSGAWDIGPLDLDPPEGVTGMKWEEALGHKKCSGRIRKVILTAMAELENHEVNKVRVDLGENPANAVWFWGAGSKNFVEPFERRFGLKAAAVTTDERFAAVASAAGIQTRAFSPMTDTQELKGFSDEVLLALEEKDLAVACMEEVEASSLAGDYRRKARWIEALDHHLIGEWSRRLGSSGRILVSACYFGYSERRELGGGAVPYLASGAGGGAEAAWDEESAGVPPSAPVRSRELFHLFLRG